MEEATPLERSMAVPVLIVRCALGGVLMGLANLVPGISGGTMLLAAGVYPLFINGIAEVTTLKFRFRSLVMLGTIVLSAMVAVLLLAGLVKGLVVDYRWIMYSLFIGLTLGGVPIVWRMIGTPTPRMWAGAAAGFLAMTLLAWVQQRQMGAGGGGDVGMGLLLAAGMAGAGAMILPGVSGGYLLLVLGVYVPILGAIDRFKEALKAGDIGVALEVGLTVVLPVGVGVIVGVVAVSNLLRLLLRRYPKATLGVLLGLLLGAVVGLWPFQRGVEPAIGATIKGRPVTAERLAELDPGDYPSEFFRPAARHIGGAAACVAAGFLITFVISRLGRRDEDAAA